MCTGASRPLLVSQASTLSAVPAGRLVIRVAASCAAIAASALAGGGAGIRSVHTADSGCGNLPCLSNAYVLVGRPACPPCAPAKQGSGGRCRGQGGSSARQTVLPAMQMRQLMSRGAKTPAQNRAGLPAGPKNKPLAEATANRTASHCFCSQQEDLGAVASRNEKPARHCRVSPGGSCSSLAMSAPLPCSSINELHYAQQLQRGKRSCRPFAAGGGAARRSGSAATLSRQHLWLLGSPGSGCVASAVAAVGARRHGSSECRPQSRGRLLIRHAGLVDCRALETLLPCQPSTQSQASRGVLPAAARPACMLVGRPASAPQQLRASTHRCRQRQRRRRGRQASTLPSSLDPTTAAASGLAWMWRPLLQPCTQRSQRMSSWGRSSRVRCCHFEWRWVPLPSAEQPAETARAQGWLLLLF